MAGSDRFGRRAGPELRWRIRCAATALRGSGADLSCTAAPARCALVTSLPAALFEELLAAMDVPGGELAESDSQITMAVMRTMTATEASRRFSDLLDAVEAGETVTITRGNRPIAEIGPARRRTGADLRAALEGTTPPDDAFEQSIAAAVKMLGAYESDPWTDA
jgi:prevent-host-death family protein